MGKCKKLEQEDSNTEAHCTSSISCIRKSIKKKEKKKSAKDVKQESDDGLNETGGNEDLPNIVLESLLVKKIKKNKKNKVTEDTDSYNKCGQETNYPLNKTDLSEHRSKKKKSHKDSTDPKIQNNTQSELDKEITHTKESRRHYPSNETDLSEHRSKKKKSLKDSTDPESQNNTQSESDEEIRPTKESRRKPKLDLSLASVKPSTNPDTNSKQPKQQGNNQFEDEDTFDPNELDAFCDDVDEEDNQIYLNWVQLLENKLSAGASGNSLKNSKTVEVASEKCTKK